MEYQWNPISNYMVQQFGGKKAFLLTSWHQLLACLGRYGRYRRIEWHRVSRVIFICKGNICRSAFAGRRFRAFGLEAASAGLDADSGKPADPRAVLVARRLGIELASHRSTHVSQLDPGEADLLVAFEPGQADRLRALYPGRPGPQVTLLGLWGPFPGMAHIHDPYGTPESYFETCFGRIERRLEGLRAFLADARPARREAT